jgi:hypothetical protein
MIMKFTLHTFKDKTKWLSLINLLNLNVFAQFSFQNKLAVVWF